MVITILEANVPAERQPALRDAYGSLTAAGLRAIMAEHQPLGASDTSIRLAGKEGGAKRLRYPPTLEQLRLGKRLEHDARRFFVAVGSLPLVVSIVVLLPFQFLDHLVQFVEA